MYGECVLFFLMSLVVECGQLSTRVTLVVAARFADGQESRIDRLSVAARLHVTYM